MSWRVSMLVFCGLLVAVITVRLVERGTDGTGTHSPARFWTSSPAVGPGASTVRKPVS